MRKRPLVQQVLPALLSILGLPLAGCEDVITLDLKTTQPRLVITGQYYTGFRAGARFVLTRSTDFFRPSIVERVSGASIEITNDFGDTISLVEAPETPGIYENDTYQGIAGRTYHATVTVGDETYKATSTMPQRMPIDSLMAVYQEGGGVGVDEDQGYRVHVYFRDNPGIHDYARIWLWRNGDWWANMALYDGKFSDGNPIEYEYFSEVGQAGSYVQVELLSMDKNLYDYFSTLSEVIIWEDLRDNLDATPANPNTNWMGGALGYFAAFNTSYSEMTIETAGQVSNNRALGPARAVKDSL